MEHLDDLKALAAMIEGKKIAQDLIKGKGTVEEVVVADDICSSCKLKRAEQERFLRRQREKIARKAHIAERALACRANRVKSLERYGR